MLSTGYETLTLKVGPSKLFRAWVGAAHGAVLLVLLMAVGERQLIALALAFWVLSLVLCIRLSLRSYTLSWHKDGSWSMDGGKDYFDSMALARYVTMGPSVVSLRFNDGPRGWWLVFHDALPLHDYRELRRRLFSDGDSQGTGL